MSTQSNKEVDAYFTNCKAEGERLTKEVFPKKILELNKLLETEQFGLSRLSKIETDLNIPQPAAEFNYDDLNVKKSTKNDVKRDVIGDVRRDAVRDLREDVLLRSKVYMLPCGAVPCNQHIVQLIDIIKPHLVELMEYCEATVKWLKLSIPKIEDGNNFGVSIQTDTMGGVKQVESSAEARIDDIFDYHAIRAKIASKIAKYPHLDDYRRVIKELDEKQFIHLRRVVKEISNQYAYMYDVLTKNMDKILNPRSSNADSLY